MGGPAAAVRDGEGLSGTAGAAAGRAKLWVVSAVEGSALRGEWLQGGEPAQPAAAPGLGRQEPCAGRRA